MLIPLLYSFKNVASNQIAILIKFNLSLSSITVQSLFISIIQKKSKMLLLLKNIIVGLSQLSSVGWVHLYTNFKCNVTLSVISLLYLQNQRFGDNSCSNRQGLLCRVVYSRHQRGSSIARRRHTYLNLKWVTLKHPL